MAGESKSWRVSCDSSFSFAKLRWGSIYLFIFGLESKRVLRLIAGDILYTSYSLKQFSTCVYNVNLKQVR